MLSVIFTAYSGTRSDINQHNTIYCYELHVPRSRTNLGKQALKVRGREYYNELSTIFFIKILKSFTRVVQNHIIQSYLIYTNLPILMFFILSFIQDAYGFDYNYQ